MHSRAQQVPDLYHYYRYPALVNPAATGMEDYTEVLTVYKNQWWGVPDAPQTQMLMLNTPLKIDKLGLGFTIYNDMAHIIGTTGAYASSAYRIKLTPHQFINFGLTFGAYNTRIFFDKIRAEDPFEATLLNNSESMVKADLNAGILYKWKNLQLGFSSFHLQQNSFQFENGRDQKSLAYKLIRHYTISASYKFSIKERINIEPLLLVRSAQGLPSQVDINTTIMYKGKVWTNLAYRHQSGMGMAIGFLVDDKLSVGYHYEYPTTGIKKITSGSHEFSLSYRFGRNKDAPIKIEGIEKLQKENEEQYEMIDQLEKKTDTLKKRVDQHDEEIKKLKEIFKREQKESEDFKSKEQIPPTEIKKIIKQEQKVDENSTREEKEIKDKERDGEDALKPDSLSFLHEAPKRGLTHLDFYLVVSSFSTVQDAKLFQHILKREYDLDTWVALSRPIHGRSRFLVYTKIVRSTDDPKWELKQIKDLDTKKLYPQEPWLYRIK